jgi:radical SAM protein with 4Fe4S-binding SPASM domain
MERLRAESIGISINSTLTLLTPTIANELRKLGIKSFLTSVHSYDPATDANITNSKSSWDLTSHGIKTAIDAGFNVTANMVVSQRNLHQIFDTARYVKSLGVKRFAASKVSKPSNASSEFNKELLTLSEFRYMAQELRRVKNELRIEVDSVEAYASCAFDDPTLREEIEGFRRSCTAGKMFCVLGVDGRIRPCPLVEDYYGSLFDDDGLRMAWTAMYPWRTDQYLPPKCSHCRLRNSCAGGCKAEAKHVNGSYSMPEPYCDYKQVPGKLSRQENASLPNYFAFNPQLRFREESFGGILYIDQANWMSVTHELYRFAKDNKSTYEVDTFSGLFGISPESMKPTLHKLLGKKIIVDCQNSG